MTRVCAAPSGYFFDVITNGYGVMYSYADRVPPADRWAIAAYIRALQLSQGAKASALPPEDREQLERGRERRRPKQFGGGLICRTPAARLSGLPAKGSAERPLGARARCRNRGFPRCSRCRAGRPANGAARLACGRLLLERRADRCDCTADDDAAHPRHLVERARQSPSKPPRCSCRLPRSYSFPSFSARGRSIPGPGRHRERAFAASISRSPSSRSAAWLGLRCSACSPSC